jgi:hypothetical protein
VWYWREKFADVVFERMWKEEVISCFKILSQHLPRTAKKHDEKDQKCQPPRF